MFPMLLTAVALLAPAPNPPEPLATEPVAVAHWDCDGTLESGVGGQGLRPSNPAVIGFAPADVLGIQKNILQLPPGQTLEVPTGFRPRGPGFIGSWTLILDVRIAEEGAPFAFGLVQTDRDNDDFAELYVNSARGFGFERRFAGAVPGGIWQRIALTADRETGRVAVYRDGEVVTTVSRPLGDSRYTLEPSLLLFADKSLKSSAIEVAMIHLRSETLNAQQLATLGKPSRPLPETMRARTIVESWELRERDGRVVPADRTIRRGESLLITWTTKGLAGDVALVAHDVGAEGPGRLIGRMPAMAQRALLTMPLDLGWDRVRLEVIAGHEVAGRDDNRPARLVRTIALADPPLGSFGGELARNGDFEAADGRGPARNGQLPADWRITGEARLGRIGPGFHLVGAVGSWVAQQTLEIPVELRGADGAVRLGIDLRIAGELRRELRRGRLDDRGWVEALFRGADGQIIGTARTLHVDGQSWHRRETKVPIPTGTHAVELRVIAHHRRGAVCSVRVDNVSATFEPTTALAPIGLRKLPVLHASDDPGLHRLVLETAGDAVRPEVVWGSAGEPGKQAVFEAITVDGDHQIWQMLLTPLKPAAEHWYEVRLGPDVIGRWTFRAPDPAEGHERPLRVAWMADNQFGWETFARLLPIVKQQAPQLLVLAGDIVQNGDQRREWQTEWFSPLASASFGQTIATQFARGNHDGEHALTYAYTWLPGNGAWFAYTRAGVRFIFLDTEADPSETPDQVAWLQRELKSPASREADFRIVVMHKPAYANRWDSARSRYDGEPQVRKHFVPLFHAHKVDLVVAGHAHAYQRRDFEGVRYVVVGGAGGRLDTYKTANWPMTVDWVGYHYALLDIAGGRLEWTATSLEGETIDTFTLKKRARPTATSARRKR